MTTLYVSAVTNAVIVLPLAILVWTVGRIARRPALTHALWIVVLLKLVTPPLFHLPVPISLSSEIKSASRELAVASGTDSIRIDEFRNTASVAARAASSDEQSLVGHDISTLIGRSPETTLVSTRSRGERSGLSSWLALCMSPVVWSIVVTTHFLSTWEAILVNIWIGGTVVAFGIQTWMVIRFARNIAAVAIVDLELQQQTEQLAHRMGMRRCPMVRVVSATITPMLWSCGSHAKLLFPMALKDCLSLEARATLLMHELAHLGRGDHWVRWLELLATGFFWWHPIVWWARHQIEESEEECCDAWVVAEIPHNPRRYADALLDAIDFLCVTSSARPPMTSGLGNAPVLRRRLTKIMRAGSPKEMSRRVRATVALLMAFLLSVQPLVFGSTSKTAVVGSVLLPVMRPVVSSGKPSTIEPQPAESIQESSADLPSIADVDSPATIHPIGHSLPPLSKSRALRGEKIWSSAVSSDGRFVVRATTGRRVLLSDLISNREFDLSSYGITAVSFTPDGRQFVAVASDGRVMLWDAADNALNRVLYTCDNGLRSVCVSPQGDAVVVGGQDGTLLLLNLKSGETLTPLSRQSLPVNCVRFSPDASRLAVAQGEWMTSSRGRVRLINLKTGVSEVIEFKSTPGAITFVSNDELIVGAGKADKGVVAAASFSPDNPELREIAFVSPGVSEE